MHAYLNHRHGPDGRLGHVAVVDLDPADEISATLDRACAWATAGDVAWSSGPDLRAASSGDVIFLDGAAAFEAADDGWSRVPLLGSAIPGPVPEAAGRRALDRAS